MMEGLFALPNMKYLIDINKPSLALVPIGDIHAGAEAHKGKHFKKTIDYVDAHGRDKSCPHRWFYMGDGAEHVTPKKGGAQLQEQVIAPTDQYKYLDGLFRPIKKLCLGGVCGNHEQRAIIDAMIDPVELMFHSWGVPERYFNVGGSFQIKVREQIYVVTIFHGRRNSQANIYQEHLLRWRAYPRSDVIVIGHTHALGHYENVYLKVNPETGREEAGVVHFVRSGTYLGYANYAKEFAYPPGRIGSPIIYFSGKEHKVHVDDQALAAI